MEVYIEYHVNLYRLPCISRKRRSEVVIYLQQIKDVKCKNIEILITNIREHLEYEIMILNYLT